MTQTTHSLTIDTGLDYPEIREGVKRVCADFPGAYWRGLEDKLAYPTEFVQALTASGYLGALIPEEYGGSGMPLRAAMVILETIHASGCNAGACHAQMYTMGTVLRHGSDAQKKKYLPDIASGKLRLQAFGVTEPTTGTDTTKLKTRAERQGDHYVINGQKVWTTGGHHADYCFLLTRTDPDAPKHKGISYLLVPMRQEGVEVRGIVQPDGTAEFCEVFFTNARCPKDNVVGGANNGWKVTNSTLAFERGMSATTGYRRFEEEYKMMVRVATENGTIEHDDIRQRLMQYYTKIQLLRINGLRSLTATLNNSKDFGVMALGASNKMFWSEMHKAAMELALDIFGAQGMLVDAGPETGSWPGVAREKRREGYPVSPMMSAFFFSRSETIWGGTSQIQRNIVGERVLGLPKEPSAG